MPIPECHVNAWHVVKVGGEFIITLGSSDAKTQRLIVGMSQALDFITKVEDAINKEKAGE